MMIAELGTLMLACFFTGAAFYISAVEQPARMHLSAASLLTQWKPSYRRGFALQSTLALLTGSSGIILGIVENEWVWGLGGMTMLANWPYTLIFIMGLNKKLLNLPPRSEDEMVLADIRRWERLHRVRIGLGAVTSLFYAGALVH